MKKITIILILAAVFVLSACAGQVGAAIPVEPSATPGVVSENYANALPVASQLALGTLQLKGTANAVNAQDAAALLPLWKALAALSASTTSSKIEVNALIEQIQSTMKTDQLQAIAALKLTQADVAKAAQDLGLAQGAAPAGRTSGTGTTSGTSSSGTNRGQQGGFGGEFGGPGGFGGNIPGTGGQTGTGSSSGSVPASTQATVQARAAQRAQAENTLLYTAVVNYLTQLAGK